MKNKLNEKIASRLNKQPSLKIDQTILKKANHILDEKTNYFNLGLGITSFAMMAVLIFNVNNLSIDNSMPKGSEEMVSYHQEMEIMASLGELSESELESVLKE